MLIKDKMLIRCEDYKLYINKVTYKYSIESILLSCLYSRNVSETCPVFIAVSYKIYKLIHNYIIAHEI